MFLNLSNICGENLYNAKVYTSIVCVQSKNFAMLYTANDPDKTI